MVGAVEVRSNSLRCSSAGGARRVILQATRRWPIDQKAPAATPTRSAPTSPAGEIRWRRAGQSRAVAIGAGYRHCTIRPP
jgi:hypothetical protein